MPRVIYFSIVRERIGKDQEDIDFKGPVGKLREVIREKYPHVGDVLERVKFAVNEEYVDDSYTLEGDETVAVIPPVSGG